MAVGTGTALLGSAVIGAIANRNSGEASSTMSRNVGQAGYNENEANAAIMEQLQALRGFANAGPGQADVAAGYAAQNDLAAMLRQFSQGGYAPTEADQLTARSQMAPQFEQARQNQVLANQQFRQQAAVSGRGPMDFAFTNRLNQNTANQMNMLSAQQSQLAAQQPMQRLGFMQDFASLKQGLATQAMQNRLAISSLGSSIRDSAQNFRLGAASTTQTGSSGSQMGNMLMGGLAGAGTGLSLYNMFNQKSNNMYGNSAGQSYNNVGNIV